MITEARFYSGIFQKWKTSEWLQIVHFGQQANVIFMQISFTRNESEKNVIK